jgi:hypothetical protein
MSVKQEHAGNEDDDRHDYRVARWSLFRMRDFVVIRILGEPGQLQNLNTKNKMRRLAVTLQNRRQ